jgi:outer membrane lipoprotein-sorting protein
MKQILRSLLVVACIAAAENLAEAAQEPTVDSILAKHVESVGGKAALEKITSRVIKGKVENALLPSGIEWTFFAKSPSKQLVVMEIPGLGTSQDGFDGETAWSRNMAGVRVKTGEELAKVKRDSTFRRELNYKTLFPNLTYKGTQTIGNDEANVLESVPSADSKERFFFSKKSGLLVRQESEFKSGQGRVVSNAELSDYRDVDGIKQAYLIKGAVSAGGQEMEFTLRVSEIQHNVKIEDTRFGKPTS